MMTRSKRFVEEEDEDSVIPKKKAVEKKGIDDKKNDVKGESNLEKEKINLGQLMKGTSAAAYYIEGQY